MTHWSEKYIGLPYRLGGRDWNGVDCWGLLYLYFKEERGILLPELSECATWNLLELSSELVKGVQQGWKLLREPEEGCAVAMSLRTVPHHVGIWTEADGGKVLHCWSSQPVVADTMRGLRAKGIRTVEFYGFHY